MNVIPFVSRGPFCHRAARAAALALPFAAVVVLHAGPGDAQQACGDTSCGLGTRCTTYERECPPALEGEGPAADCEPETLFHCTPAECTSDGDCASHMRCAERPRQECEGEYPSCIDGESDEQCIARVLDWQAESCRTVSPLLCTPHWQLPCASDADCGELFRCDSGACALLDERCSADAHCPVSWVCATLDVGPCRRVPGDDDCVRSEPPEQRCVEPVFGVRESLDVSSSMPPQPSSPSATPASGSAGAGCSVGAARSVADRAGLVGLLALALLPTARALRRRRSTAAR